MARRGLDVAGGTPQAEVMSDPEGWSEEDSTFYASVAPIAVPSRAEQMAVLATLAPLDVEGPARVVELACGEGKLSRVLLECFPQASLLALDGSEEMRSRTTGELADFGDRARVEPFDIYSEEWFGHMNKADLVVSSLCIHHLDAEQKKDLFDAAFARLNAGGALLIADLVLPQRAEANEVFSATWDSVAEEQATSMERPDLYDSFRKVDWNYFRHPDPFDKPSPLIDQLRWLEESGFEDVDCHWLNAGHAIYGGYLRRENPQQGKTRLTYNRALEVATEVVGSPQKPSSSRGLHEGALDDGPQGRG